MPSVFGADTVRAIVCGGRRYNDSIRLADTLDRLHRVMGFKLVIHGGAAGADLMAEDWAIDRDIQVLCYPALWHEHGRKAGPIRNQLMIDEGKPDIVIAFPGGSGTKDMINRARKAKVRVLTVAA